jgi:TonB family protein
MNASSIVLQSFVGFQGTARVFEVSANNHTRIDWLRWINLIYWSGVIFFLLQFIKEVISIINTIHKYPHHRFPAYTLVTTDYEHLPFSFMGYIFISRKVQFKDDELNRILEHEGSHVQGIHSLDVLLVEIIKAFAWFSPLVYWYKNTIRNTHEYLADALVLKHSDTRSYGQLLINNAQHGMQMALANHFIYSQLKNRINMMIQSPSRRINVWKYTLIIPVLLILGVMFAYRSDPNKNVLFPVAEKEFISNDSLPEGVLYFLNGEKTTIAEIKNILPQQITSVTVIKDTEQLKPFGDEGKHGVIQIVTRTLYFVDGVESTKEAVDKIDPEKIESMDVVKYGKSEKGLVKIKLKSDSLKSIQGQALRTVDQMPEFPGGNVALLKYLANNIKYPNEAKEKNIQGRLISEFIVDIKGKINEAKIIQGIGGGCDEEAIRILNKMNADGIRWKPGINNGLKVPVVITLPISYKLGNDKSVLNGDTHLIDYSNEEPLKEVEQMPQFPGGQAALMHYLANNIKYPNIAKQNKIEGKVIVSFVVEKNGTIGRFKMERGIGAGCNEEALRVLHKMNHDGIQWEPGKDKGEAVLVLYTLPISFKLESKKSVDSDIPPSPPLSLNIIKSVDEMPQFSGGDEKLLKFITEHLQYPLIAKDSGIQGRVILSFVVARNGSVYNTKVLKGIGGGCDAESVRMVNSMNELGIKWLPGKLKGQPVDVEFTLPISFKLTGEAQKMNSNLSSNINTSSSSNSNSSINTHLSTLKIIPNPANHQIEINGSLNGDVRIELIDISGRVVHNSRWADFNGRQIIDVHSIPKGTYIVRITQHGKSEETKVVLQ